MKGKLEDRLAQLAFGDLSPSEDSELERLLGSDPEARRSFQMYRDMKHGLKSLSDIPDDQFSKERLRNAILTQGLKPAPVKQVNPNAWLWMPCAACLLGFLMMYERHMVFRSKANPEIVMSANLTKSRTAVAFDHANVIDRTIRVASTTAVTPQHGIHTVALRSHHYRHAKPVPDPNVIYADWEGMDDNSLPSSPDHGPSLASKSTAPVNTVATVEASPIVFIDSNKDAQTGAQKATEVGSASNVLVGG